MKKLLALLVVALCLSGCNYKMLDTTWSFDRAYIEITDGQVIEVEVKSWKDYEEGDQLQVTGTDGRTYLVHSSKCVLVDE